MKSNITLVGMPASGKSTIGVLLAKRLGYSFVDVDIVIQEKTGQLLKEIIAERGTDGFLKVEEDNKRAESHRNYIDIQYLFTGKEVQGYAPLLPGVTGEEPAGKDNIFYETVENEQFVTLHPGEFTVYFTNDIHRPNCTMDEPVNIHKAVVKIKESLIK